MLCGYWREKWLRSPLYGGGEQWLLCTVAGSRAARAITSCCKSRGLERGRRRTEIKELSTENGRWGTYSFGGGIYIWTVHARSVVVGTKLEQPGKVATYYLGGLVVPVATRRTDAEARSTTSSSAAYRPLHREPVSGCTLQFPVLTSRHLISRRVSAAREKSSTCLPPGTPEWLCRWQPWYWLFSFS